MQTGKAQKERAPNATQSREDILETRQQLPIYQARKEILFEMRRHDTLVLVGETGSGKTTQMPQFLLEAGTAKKGMIGITQPRRVAATSVAARVAVEMGVMLGKEVGYAVRFDDTTSPNTKIKFMTDGMLVSEMMLDPQLRRYSVLLLDEAHERSLNTEVLFALVKRMQMLRKDSPRPLKLVVMSATLEAQAYAAFFHNSKVLHVEGRRYPVDVLYTAEPHADSLDAAVAPAVGRQAAALPAVREPPALGAGARVRAGAGGHAQGRAGHQHRRVVDHDRWHPLHHRQWPGEGQVLPPGDRHGVSAGDACLARAGAAAHWPRGARQRGQVLPALHRGLVRGAAGVLGSGDQALQALRDGAPAEDDGHREPGAL